MPARPLVTGVVVGLAAAGAVHLGVGLDHGGGGHGPWLVAAGVVQLGAAAAIAHRPAARRLRWAALASAVAVAAWVVTRATGAQGVGTLDAGTAVAQAATVAGALLLARQPAPGTRPGVRMGAALATGLLVGLAATLSAAGGHDHDHRRPPAPPAAATPTTSIFGDLFTGHEAHQAPTRSDMPPPEPAAADVDGGHDHEHDESAPSH